MRRSPARLVARPCSSMPCRPPISRPISLERRPPPDQACRDSPPTLITAMRSVSVEQLVEVLRDHQRPPARARARSSSAWWIGGRGAGIDAPGRLRDHQDARVLQDLAADDEFLQVAAGEGAGRGRGAGRPHVEARITASAKRCAAPRADEAARRPAACAAGRVRSAFSVSDMSGTAAWPLRSSGTQHRPRRRRPPAPMRPTRRSVDAPCRRCATRRSPESACNSSFWPLPATPAMPRISPRRTSKDMSLRSVPNGSSAGRSRLRTIRRGSLRASPARRATVAQLGADHQLRHALARSRPRDRRSPRPCRRAGSWRRRRAP